MMDNMALIGVQIAEVLSCLLVAPTDLDFNMASDIVIAIGAVMFLAARLYGTAESK
jgi:hypothetical protein